MLNRNTLKTCIGIAIIIFGLDQITKILVISYMPNTLVAVMPYLNFSLAYNKGAAFGMLSSAGGWQIWAFIAIAIIVSIVILMWSKKLRFSDKWENVALALILGGAWGNLLDRIRTGQVVDFIDFYIGDWHWYTFNLADTAICIGAAILICISLFKK